MVGDVRKMPGAMASSVRMMLSVRSFLPVLMYATAGGQRQASMARRISDSTL
jgi:hypothetical protein